MLLWPVILVIHGASLAGCAPVAGFEGKPENITVMFLSPSEVRVSWTAADGVEKYDVSYKPTDARVVKLVAGNSGSVTLRELRPDTQYSVTVIAFRGGERFRSRSVVFRTLEMQTEVVPRITGSPPGGTISGFPSGPNPSFSEAVGQVRGIEVGIVCLVLIVWVGSIALFFNRWGKIRMLLPYQPDYKDTQLKVPGTGACQPPCQSASASAFCCPQRYVHRCADDFDWRGRPSRSRINSAIYIATHHRSEEHEPLFDTSMSVVRKVKSADNLPTTADYNSQPGDSLPMTDYSRRHDVPVLSISDATDRPIVEQHL